MRLVNNKKNRIRIFSMLIVLLVLIVLVITIAWTNINGEKTSKFENINNLETVIVLGAGLWGDKVSPQLALRLDETIMVSELNNDLVIIVSGGRGADELISEAEAMKAYLINAGINSENIHMEDQSTSTVENIKYSIDLLEELNLADSNIGVITTDFHMCRAKLIGKRLGIHFEGQSAPNIKSIETKNFTREILALIKDFLLARK